MHKLAQVWRVSLLKTLANKHKTSVNKVAQQLKTEDGYALIVPGEKKTRVIRIFRLKDLRTPLPSDPGIDTQPNVYIWTLSRSEVIKRLNRGQCEYCETKQGPFEVHHIQKNTRPLSTLPPPASYWNTPRKRGFQTCVDGEPDACKRASPVLREGVG